VIVEKNSAVHLAGESHGCDGIAVKAGGLKSFAHGESGGPPPIARVLLGPAGLWTRKVGVLFGPRGEDGAVVVEDDGAGSAGADINA
jgi:hypothetical protein